METMTLLGDEAIALGAIHAGLSAAYAYPGTPSTEILETLATKATQPGATFKASWTTNEKTAYEQALGVSLAGRRTMVSMKHVGLNVAADPFMNSAVTSLKGGLVIAVADDPGMHSSQNEQDSRYYADFAHTVCFEPADPQEAYNMTREAFDVSEKFHLPVLLRLVTRLAHSRSAVTPTAARPENPISKATTPSDWILMPAISRKHWRNRIEQQQELRNYSESTPYNTLSLESKEIGVITTGLAKNYFLENLEDLSKKPSHLHIGAYPIPVEKIRKLVGHVKTLLILEEGYPFVERFVRGIISPEIKIQGRITREIPPDGELTPEIVRKALGLTIRQGVALPTLALPGRPPQLCTGCPHGDTFTAIKKALSEFTDSASGPITTSDIGCYTLGALPPYSALQSCVCMGASIGMAKGAADAGIYPAVAIIGDSTFLHSGIQPLIDAIAADTNMTVVIADNEAVAMTGGQKTQLNSSRVHALVAGLGINPEHLHVLTAHPKELDKNVDVFRKELKHQGLSVIITVRECLETLKKKKK